MKADAILFDTPVAEPASPTERIVTSVTDAISGHRLHPGTRLTEQKLAGIFGVSRTIVRQALLQLERDKLVTIEPSRGAFVAMPGVDEARQVFEVRRMLELPMIERLCDMLRDEHIAALRQHLQDERNALVRTADVPGRTRLLGDFHVVLARMLGNHVLTDLVTELTARTSLITLLYQSARSAAHSSHEHDGIVDALERRDAQAAADLMRAHLDNVEGNLRLEVRTPDLGAVLRQ